MKQHFGSVVPLCLLFAGLSFTASPTAAAQDQAANTTPPPKVLVVITEQVRPGQSGSAHLKTESAFVDAYRNANWPEHYMALDALTGKPRVIFLVAYDSFADWQKDDDATQKNSSLSAALDSASIADGALLESTQTSAYVYRDDLSLRGPADIIHSRYFEITIFRLRSGHAKDWDSLVKMYMTAFDKVPDAHWATFEKKYGADSGNTFIVVSPMKSLLEVDQEIMDDKKLPEGVSADQMQKMHDLGAVTIESTNAELFAINPKMSYAPDKWVQADPDFWGQK